MENLTKFGTGNYGVGPYVVRLQYSVETPPSNTWIKKPDLNVEYWVKKPDSTIEAWTKFEPTIIS